MGLFQAARIVVPIASEEDAIATMESLNRHVIGPGAADLSIVFVHVIEKGGGTIDKAPLGARRVGAEEALEVARNALSQSDIDVSTSLVYETDLIDGIVSAATDHAADAIVIRPRESGRLMRLLTGDRTARLVHQSAIPVVVLPAVPDTTGLEDDAKS